MHKQVWEEKSPEELKWSFQETEKNQVTANLILILMKSTWDYWCSSKGKVLCQILTYCLLPFIVKFIFII